MSKKEIRLSVLELEKLGITLSFPQNTDAKAEENTRRLATCWNACEGISTETLQQSNIADRVARLERQRDELLAAAEKAVQVLKQYHDRFMSAGRWEEDSYRQKSLVYRDIMKAITKVKGGAE